MDSSSISLSIVADRKNRRKTVSDFFLRRQTKNKSEEEQLRILLQNLISDLSFGIDVIPGKKSPRPVVKKNAVENYINGHGNSAPRSFSHKQFKKHRRQEQHLYFYGRDGYSQNGKRKQFLSLLMIDIDCHKKGTTDGAWQLVNALKKRFPGSSVTGRLSGHQGAR